MERYPSKIKILEQSNKELVFATPIFWDQPKMNDYLQEGRRKNSYSAIFSDVTIIGGSNVTVFANSISLYDLKCFDKNNKYKYSDLGIKYYNNHDCLVYYENINLKIDSAISIVCNYSWNYYHYFYEGLVKLIALEELNIDIDIPIIVDEICLKIPQFKELLTILNSKKRQIITLLPKTSVFVKNLYYISCPNIIPPNFINENNIKPSDVLYDKQIIYKLREAILPHSSGKEFFKNIFISRSLSKSTRKYNEDDVFNVLQNFGFQKICPEQLSIADQIALFNNANCIVGASGAAFTNLLFCKPTCKIVILTKKNIPISCFSSISTIVGSQLRYVTEDEMQIKKGKMSIHDSFYITPEKIKSATSTWLIES
ncbi:MAG TPA: glycosyltransferase family 61 protein [Tenuifilaceae bacterium]|nr:glycosyltransferase family 61 protein [Tenuifilaceae bacterium]